MRSLPLGAEVAEGPHVVHAVGQFDHDDADVLDHGQQHLAEAFGLPVFGREEIELGELGDAVHTARHFFAELPAHLLDGDAGVLDHIVQQSRLHGDDIHPHAGQDMGHHDGMHHVGLAGVAGLAFMVPAGEAIGLFERGEIVFGPVLANLDFQLAVQLFDWIGGGVSRRRPGTDSERPADSEGTVPKIVSGEAGGAACPPLKREDTTSIRR